LSKPTLNSLIFMLVLAALPLALAHAQDGISADRKPTMLTDTQENAEREYDWQIAVGGAVVYGPAFLGSKDYQLSALPNVEVRYKDRFFISVIDGIGADLIKKDNFRAGPVVKYNAERNENGKNVFAIAGARTLALRGLGTVAATAEVGGFAQYDAGKFSVKAEVRKGIGGHDGLIAEFGARYTTGLMDVKAGNQNVVMSIGPRATVVNDAYNQAYYGVDAGQSGRSGLARFDSKGGLLSYGLGATLIVPLTRNFNAVTLGSFDRLSGDAAKSPLVRQRGSRNQATIGLGLSYEFGM
jgi:MipA family protein